MFGRAWEGIVTEVLMSGKDNSSIMENYKISLAFINKTKNFYQILMQYQKLNEKNYHEEYINMTIFKDGSIKGQDANGILDGKIFEKEGIRKMEISYRSFLNKKGLMHSYFGELEELN